MKKSKSETYLQASLDEVIAYMRGDINLGEFEISFISTLFGAMSAKVNTIIDFFFGGSAKKNK